MGSATGERSPARERSKPIGELGTRGRRPADDQNGVFTGYGADDLRPGLVVDGLGNGLGSPRKGVKNQQLTHTVDIVEELAAPGSTMFRFDGTQFIFNWQTTKSWAGTCRLMTVTLKDGNVYSAQFTFK